MAKDADGPVLEATVSEWQVGGDAEESTIRITVESSGGSRTRIAEARAEPGEYKLVRCGDPGD